MKNKKIIIILTSMIVLIGGIFLVYSVYQNKGKLNKTKRKRQSNLAIMIKEDSATEYTKSSSKDIPKGDYTLNREKSYCKNNGVIGDYDSNLGKVSFSFIGTDSCYLYFDYNESNELYKLIARRYRNNDSYVKLYDPSAVGDPNTYLNNIYYFNGAVEDNNVLFGGFCWKIVRTTDTGGVKLVYNGVQKDTSDDYTLLNESEYTNLNNDATYPYTFDSTNKTWTSTNTDANSSTITFDAPSNGNYVLNYDLSMSDKINIIYVEIFKDDVSQGTFTGVTSGQIFFGNLNATNVIKVVFTRKDSSTSGSRNNVIFSFGKANNIIKSCNNIGTETQIGESRFNPGSMILSYVGYMYNTIYKYNRANMSSVTNIVFGNSFTYANENYTLNDTITETTWSSEYKTINNNHYTCFTTDTTCTSLYYVYYTNSTYAYAIKLEEGKTVSDALNEMLYADDVNTKDSTIKAYIDEWYENNLIDYEDKLEDTVFCNDRSTISLGGWNPNGGGTVVTDSADLSFKNYYLGTASSSLACSNETDMFSVNNTKAKLTYPVGLLSVPEARLAGILSASNSNSYLRTYSNYWLISPEFFSTSSNVNIVNFGGNFFSATNTYKEAGVRPSVSLKPGIKFTTGDGSFTNPFVIE